MGLQCLFAKNQVAQLFCRDLIDIQVAISFWCEHKVLHAYECFVIKLHDLLLR